jgi:trk system potassium uptake protein
LITTLGLLLAGTVGIVFTEWRNEATLAPMDAATGVLNALFLSVAARTAGFNAIDIGAMTAGGQLVLIALMFIGGAAGSMAGGIKVQTFSLLFFAIVSALRGKEEVEAFHRRVPTATVLRALAVSLLGIAVVFAGVFALSLTDSFAFNRGLFEIVSAFGTVGLTTGITPEMSPGGRLVLILVMFIGRLGPLTLALALTVHQSQARYNWPQESIRIG